MSKFAGRLKLLRTEAGLTQQDFANIIMVKRTTIGMYEAGKREPDFETMEKIADYFNVSMGYLMGEDKETSGSYYLDEETADIAQALFDNKNLRILFDAARGSDPEDLRMAADFLTRLKSKERGED